MFTLWKTDRTNETIREKKKKKKKENDNKQQAKKPLSAKQTENLNNFTATTARVFIHITNWRFKNAFLKVSYWGSLWTCVPSQGHEGPENVRKTVSRYKTREEAPSSIIWTSAFSPRRETYYRLPRMCGSNRKTPSNEISWQFFTLFYNNIRDEQDAHLFINGYTLKWSNLQCI